MTTQQAELDFSEEARPEKDKVRRTLVGLCGKTLRRILLLPGPQCEDLRLLKEIGKIGPDTKIIVADNNPDNYQAMLESIEKLGLKGNLEYAHFGNIEDIPDDKLGDEFDFVNYDLLGCVSLKSLVWLNDKIRPRMNRGVLSITFAKSYRRHPEVPIILETLKKYEPSYHISYDRYRTYLFSTLNDYRSAIGQEEIELVDMYIAQFHYLFRSIFCQDAFIAPSIISASYSDTRTKMVTFVINWNKLASDKQNWPTFADIASRLPPPERFEKEREEIDRASAVSRIGTLAMELLAAGQLDSDLDKLNREQARTLLTALSAKIAKFI
jgi:hypothetical protein